MMPTKTVTLVELSGHLIDSLTLAKVMDKLQALACDYEINEIRIGKDQSEMSYARLAIRTDDDRFLAKVLDELKPYGGRVQQYQSIHLEPCPADGQPPQDFYPILSPRCQVLFRGEWVQADNQGSESAIVFDSQARTATIRPISSLRQGDMVVVGQDGVQLLSGTSKS